MGNIFISYRHDDTKQFSQRLYEKLCASISPDRIFFDREIPLGMDWEEHLRASLASCSVLIAVIGRSWSPPVEGGKSRIFNTRDHVKMELSDALRRDLTLIPVLVDGAAMPGKGDLPRSLAQLSVRQALIVGDDFDASMEKLTRSLLPLLDQPPPEAPVKPESPEPEPEPGPEPANRWAVPAIGLAFTLAGAAGWYFRQPLLAAASEISLKDPGATMLLGTLNAWLSWCVFGAGVAGLAALVALIAESSRSGDDLGFRVGFSAAGAFVSVLGVKGVEMLFAQQALWFGILAAIFLVVVILATLLVMFAG